MSADVVEPKVAAVPPPPANPPEFPQLLGHPRPLWMLFMSEFWERFAFYGIRWAMVLYIVAQFHGGDAAGERPASEMYGAYLALVYAGAIFGGYVADKLIGFQRSILLGAMFMALGLFMLASPNEPLFKLGLATIIVGNGMFKPIISTMVGKLYMQGDARRDAGFTIFYMGINIGAMIAPVVTGWLARKVFGTDTDPHYQWVFIAAGIGMVISLVWFWAGRSQLKGIGLPAPGQQGLARVGLVAVLGAAIGIPLFYFLLTIDASALQAILMALFVVPAVMLLVEGIREGKMARDKVIAMLIIFVFNVLFWMFFEQAGSSFTFLADRIVDREFGSWTFPLEWFQSVNSIAIITFAPLMAWMWVKMGRANPSIPRKFGLGLIFNGLAFLLLMIALNSMVDGNGKIPFWTLFAVYMIQSIGELCLSPIGLSMTTKLAPTRVAGMAMGCWFLSIAIGNNLAGIFAGQVSGESGMTAASAQAGYTFGFWALAGAGVLLFVIAPLVNRLMHGVK
ncbi:oligopeptide:H+ symporter [Luteimonas sp. S4-F44]|uniref:peptide MFS transporter n=1 Tax=Luteimonas sp. S4-F44 TaxID=2925842 RepID=UPI001F534C7C|nr:oligopeptide:H+ symporter [Luteimonas sp. S4-F44]UNK41951.1 oligopeptide:H+ symporter [Luteimonas sp. S4-F44]